MSSCMKVSLSIRKAVSNEAAFIVSCQIAMALETEGLTLDPQTVTAGVNRVIEDPSLGCYYVAIDEYQKPVACLLRLMEWSDWRNAEVWWIHSLYVLPEYRSRGVFKEMYHFLKAEVNSSEQVRGIRLYVDLRNIKAQAAYQKLGMSNEHYSLFEWMKTF